MAYIDPVTGAYVEDGLDALPPGYNQPKPTDAASIARMRAQLNSQEALRQQQINSQAKDRYLSSPAGLAKYAYEHMPGAPIAQAALGAASDMFGGLLGMYYGAGKGIGSAITGDKQTVSKPYADIENVAQALRYTPPTQAGRDIYEGVSKLPQVVTGSHMGMGPLPEFWTPSRGRRFTSDDVRVAGKTAIEDIRNLPMDYMNARAGLQREYPTMGSRLASTTEAAGNVARPVAEKAYDMYMNPRDAESFGINPVSNLSGLAPAGGPMYAVKPKGGNNPLNMGSLQPLEKQGGMGKYLSKSQLTNPFDVFEGEIKNHFSNSRQNWTLRDNWQTFLDNYLQKFEKDGGYAYPLPDLRKQAANLFAENFNENLNAEAGDQPLKTIPEIEKVLPLYNSWIMGQHQKYITNQLGTGVGMDPVLDEIEKANIPLSELFKDNSLTEDSWKDIANERRKSRLDTYSQIPNFDLTAPQNKNLGIQTAQTEPGKMFENVTDSNFALRNKHSFTREEASNFPVLNKTNAQGEPLFTSDTPIHDFILSGMSDSSGMPTIKTRVLKDIFSGELPAEKIVQTTPADVLRKIIKEYQDEKNSKEAIQKAKDNWRKSRFENIQSDVPYEDGSKMHVIRPEDVKTEAGKNLAFRDLGQSTIDLKQCIGAGCMNTPDYPGHGPYLEPHTGKPSRQSQPYDKTHVKRYMDRLEKGEAEIARLLDPKGVAQASIDLHYENPRQFSTSQLEGIIDRWLEDNDHQGMIDFENNAANLGTTRAVENALQQYSPHLGIHIDKMRGPQTKSINEMKGKDNGNIPEEFVPQMVQWLNQNADVLTSVRDFDKLPDVVDLNKTYDSLAKIYDKHPHWDANTVENFLDKVTDEKLLPRFFTGDDFALKATELGIDLSEAPKRKGTKAVQEAYEKLSQQLRLTYEEPYLQEYINGDIDVINSINNDIYYHANQYGLGNYSETVVMDAVDRLRKEGLHVPGRELENVAQQFEAEPAQQFRPERLTQMERDVLDANLTDLLDGHNIDPANMVEPYATDMRILMGSQRPEARLPRDTHESIIESLLNQDDGRHTENIRYIINTLQGPGYFVSMPELTTPQLENILDMVISWTERYPLND
jgi:hypothetical protein